MSQSGARQWRHECDCAAAVARERHSQEWHRMHSQVSLANAKYFITENRVADDVEEDDLRRRVRESSGTVIVCNVCGDIKEVENIDSVGYQDDRDPDDIGSIASAYQSLDDEQRGFRRD